MESLEEIKQKARAKEEALKDIAEERGISIRKLKTMLGIK